MTKDTNEKQATIESKIEENINILGYELYDIDNGELIQMAPALGYENLYKGTTYEDGTKGVLVKMKDEFSKYNNGIYMLRKMAGNELVLESIVPNTKDKGRLIQDTTKTMETFITGLDTRDLQVYDYAEIYGYVIAETVVKPLAKALYPEDKEKQNRFVLLYMPRFLSQVAYIYAGETTAYEEGINSEPFVLKSYIDQNTKTTDEESEDMEDNNEVV